MATGARQRSEKQRALPWSTPNEAERHSPAPLALLLVYGRNHVPVLAALCLRRAGDAVNVGSLFSGIGGIDLGLERAGMRVVWQCESDPYCRAVLRKHWPDVPCFEDVRAITEAEPVDLVCGGFPCQPVSLAGQRRAQDDDRWLWPAFIGVVRLLRPRYVFVENVPGLLTAGMGDVLGDLAESGYDAEWDCVSAAAVGARHRRDRVWIVAYPAGSGWQGRPHRNTGDGALGEASERSEGRSLAAGSGELLAHPEGEPVGAGLRESGPRRVWRGRPGNGCGPREFQDADLGTVQPRRIWRRAPQAGSSEWWAVEPDVGRVAHGVPSRLDRLAALGNAVVPQVAEWIGRRILEAEAERVAA